MTKIRIGTPNYMSVRPLIYGLSKETRPDVDLVYAGPDELATALDGKDLDAALIPSIEFLRGVGAHFLDGPGLIVKGATGGILLATDRPISNIRRIAVAATSRTSLAVLRILLDKTYHIMPDFCVFKKGTDQWREDYDAVLLTGDEGLRYCATKLRQDEVCHDLGEMWFSLYPTPLVLALWAYNDESRAAELRSLLTESRDLGVRDLSLLADGVARTTEYDSRFVYDYLSRGWSYQMGVQEESGLKLLEENAMQYQLIQQPRFGTLLASHR